MTNAIQMLGLNIFADGTIEDQPFNDILQILELSDQLYHNLDGEEPFLTDEQYDTLKLYAHQLCPHHVYFTGVGSAVRGGKVKLPYKLGSLDQVEIGEIDKWVNDWSLQKHYTVVSDKLDGTSGLVIYDDNGHLQIAFSRGDGIEGADIYRHIRLFNNIPQQVDKSVAIRGEVIFNHDGFEKVQVAVKANNGQPYKNARNMTAGLMNAKQHTQHQDLIFSNIKFIAYEILNYDGKDKVSMLRDLENMGFETPYWDTYLGEELTDELLAEHLNNRRTNTEYEIDGVVIDVNLAAKREQMIPTKDTLNPVYTVKYKVADAANITTAKVTNVRLALSKHGYIKPRIEIEPVELVGATIKYCTGFNMKFISDNKIQPGCTIQITRSGDVIPFCLGVVDPGPLNTTSPQTYEEWFHQNITDQLGDIEYQWNDTKIDLVSTTTTDDVEIKKIVDFFATIKAPYLKKGNIIKLYNAGHTSIPNIILLSEAELLTTIGENGRKIFHGLRKALTDIPLYTLMGAWPNLGRGIGVRKIKKLYEHFGDELLDIRDANALISVESFQRKSAEKVVNGIQEFVDFLISIDTLVTLKKYDEQSSTNMRFEGQKICMTGFRDDELKSLIEAGGGTVQSGVSGTTTLVIAKDVTSTSGKIKKARDYGIKVLSVERFKTSI